MLPIDAGSVSANVIDFVALRDGAMLGHVGQPVSIDVIAP